MSEEELSSSLSTLSDPSVQKTIHEDSAGDVDSATRLMMDDLGLSMAALKDSALFSGDEERFAFARALSRLSEMGGKDWVERGLGMEERGGKEEREGWQMVRSRWREDSL